jgi:hypothetical protein
MCVGMPPKDLLHAVTREVARRRGKCAAILEALAADVAFPEVMQRMRSPETGVLDEKAWSEIVKEGDTEHTGTVFQATAEVQRVKKQIHAMVQGLHQKYDIESGLRAMCLVTNTFSIAEKDLKGASTFTQQQLEEAVKQRHRAQASGDGGKAGWPTLEEALVPDSRALSTYTYVDAWITDPQVDILSQAVPGSYAGNLRDSRGRILERPAFLWGQPLPADTSRWWGGGREEAPEEDSEDEVTVVDRAAALAGARGIRRESRVYGVALGTAPGPQKEKSAKEEQAAAGETPGKKTCTGDGVTKSIRRARQGVKRKAQEVETDNAKQAREKSGNNKKVQGVQKKVQKAVSKKQTARLKAQGRRKYTYACPKCSSPVPSPAKVTTKEKSSTREWYRMATCSNKLCAWRGYARQLRCFFCHRLPEGCFCDGVEMFRFDGAPGESVAQDFEIGRPKLTYFLLCPGLCNGRLSFPVKPAYEQFARYRSACSTCRCERSNPESQHKKWRCRIADAICNECRTAFKNCTCVAPYAMTEMPCHTQKGARMRALCRTRKKREGLWWCGVCYDVVDVDSLTEREWEKVRSGEKCMPNCPECRGVSQKVPASVLECPRCKKIIRSSVWDGRVNKHIGVDGKPCSYRFRYRDGSVNSPGCSKYLQQCVACDRELESALFSSNALGQCITERKCKECVAEAKVEAQKNNNRVRCKFYSWCGCDVDISEEMAKRRHNLRIGRCYTCCALCQKQGRRSADPIGKNDAEDMVQCKSSNPSAMCLRLGRYQAKRRYPKSKAVPRDKEQGEAKNECLLCLRTHVLCKKCAEVVDIGSESNREKSRRALGQRHELCRDCHKNGHTPQDTETYVCRHGRCGRRGGVKQFEAQSVYNYKKGQLPAECLKCYGKRAGR